MAPWGRIESGSGPTEEVAAPGTSGSGRKEDPMHTALPVAIVAVLEELGPALHQWGQQHRDAPLTTHEAGGRATVRAALLGAGVQESTTALAPAPRRWREPCP